MTAFVTWMILRARQCRISNDVTNNLRQFINIVLDLVDVNAHVVSLLLVVAVPTRIQQLPVLFILFWIEHIVALLAKLYADKFWTVGRHFANNTKENCTVNNKPLQTMYKVLLAVW